MYGFAGVKGGCVLSNGFTELAELLARCGPTMIPDLERISRKAGECLDGGCKILVVGNGGSAAEAQHFAAELLGRFAEDRKPFAAIALSCDSSTLTALANDYGFEQVFERQVAALAQPGDLLLVGQAVEPMADLHASAEYRRRAAASLARRAIMEAVRAAQARGKHAR